MTIRTTKDLFAKRCMMLIYSLVISLTFLIALGLYLRARPVLQTNSIVDLLFSSTWHPSKGQFGLGGFIAGTLLVTFIAMIIAIPISLLSSIYLSEYAGKRVRQAVKPAIDVLAGISPVIYGVWGMIAIVPLVRNVIMTFCSERFPFFPFVSDNYTGFCALSAGIVLAVMILPIIISVTDEILNTIPHEMKESSLALGATKWETVKFVVLKKARPGIIAAIILGLSRAFGETMAVLMVAGCSMQGIPRSLFDTAYPLPAFIANTYGEMMSIPLYDSAVLLAALILLAVTMLFNTISWGMLIYLEKKGY